MRYTIDVRVDERELKTALARDVRQGLSAPQKYLLPKYFYDEAGSKLFEEITQLPEYYLTRTEKQLFASVAGDVVEAVRPQEVVELGCGNGEKFRWVLEHTGGAEAGPARYIPLDVDGALIESVAKALTRDYPFLSVHGIVGDFEKHLRHVPPAAGRRLVTFMGSTIGNLDPGQGRTLLAGIRRLLGDGGHALIGFDLVKDTAVLEAAYNDAAGVTAAFNRNVLHVVNRELGAGFRPDAFEHRAFFNAGASRIEMHLVARERQCVAIPALEMGVAFEAGETIWTESSYKFTEARVRGMLRDPGLRLHRWFTDPREWYGIALIGPA